MSDLQPAPPPLLSEWANQYEVSRNALQRLAQGLDDELANRRPGPDSWSVTECVDHLTVTVALYLPRMERAIERGRSKGIVGKPPYGKGSFLGRMILGVLDPAGGRTFKAPRIFRPRRKEYDFAAVAAELDAGLARMIELVADAEGLALGRIRLASPVSPWPRLTLAEAFEIHALHTPRHLTQAERVRAELARGAAQTSG